MDHQSRGTGNNDDSQRRAMDTIAVFLSDQRPPSTPTATSRVDAIVLCGSSVLDTVRRAAALWHEQCSAVATAAASSSPPPIFVSGGVGHSTQFLYDAVARAVARRELVRVGSIGDVAEVATAEGPASVPEADIFARILRDEYHVPPEFIHVEALSTNCGQNAEFAVPGILRLLARRTDGGGGGGGDDDVLQSDAVPAPAPSFTIALFQDPTMQRRSRMSFERHIALQLAQTGRWPSIGNVVVRSDCEPFVVGGVDVLNKNSSSGLPYSMDRYVSLLLGEIPRLRNDAGGYGPLGRNFIGECIIPDEAEAAFRTLEASHANNSRAL